MALTLPYRFLPINSLCKSITRSGKSCDNVPFAWSSLLSRYIRLSQLVCYSDFVIKIHNIYISLHLRMLLVESPSFHLFHKLNCFPCDCKISGVPLYYQASCVFECLYRFQISCRLDLIKRCLKTVIEEVLVICLEKLRHNARENL